VIYRLETDMLKEGGAVPSEKNIHTMSSPIIGSFARILYERQVMSMIFQAIERFSVGWGTVME
jgi:hypothetical protein